MIPGSATPLLLSNQDAGYKIDRSLRFNSADSAYLNRTPSSAGNRKTWTYSVWIKRCKLGTEQQLLRANAGGTSTTDVTDIYFGTDNKLNFYAVVGGSLRSNKKTAQVFRDVGAWMHLVFTLNTPASSAKIYVNGSEISDWTTNTNPSTSFDSFINSTEPHLIARNLTNGSAYGDFYLADIHLIDGQALDPTAFGEFDANNIWQAKEFTGSHNPTTGYSDTVPTSTSDVAPAGQYGNGIVTAAVLFGGTELSNNQNIIRQDGGGIEWSAAIPLSNGDVAGALCKFFNNTSNHDIEFKIDGSWVTAQTNANSVIGTTSALITYTATGSSNWTGVRATNGSNISVTSVAGIFVNDDLVGAGTTGVNGFYLDFSDNSSNAALGYDAAVDAPTLNPEGGMDVVTYTGNSGNSQYHLRFPT
jgi:hypothetical protein